MPRRDLPCVLPRAARRVAGVIILAVGLAGCGAQVAQIRPLAVAANPPALTAVRATQPIDRLTALARRRYAIEAGGPQARRTLRRVAADPVLRSLLARNDTVRLRAYVRRTFGAVWYHWHVSRLRIVRDTKIVVDAGVPFVVKPSALPLVGADGRRLATLEVSIQDVVGFVRFMHRNYPVDVVARGVGGAHMRTSLPAAGRVHLPDRGTATVSGRRYRVRSFTARALNDEPVKIWILAHL